MGTKEESRGWVLVRGYSGKIHPHQAEGGPCSKCKGIVYVDARDTGANRVPTDRVTYVHLGCEPIPASERPVSNVIPVGGGNE